MAKHYSTKTYGHNIGLSAVLDNPNGYSLQFKFTFGCDIRHGS